MRLNIAILTNFINHRTICNFRRQFSSKFAQNHLLVDIASEGAKSRNFNYFYLNWFLLLIFGFSKMQIENLTCNQKFRVVCFNNWKILLYTSNMS